MKNRNQQSFLQVSLSSIIVQKQKIEPQLTGIKQNAGATKQSKIKIHNSKISSNLDLPHSLVFNVLFSSLNFCVGDIKHIKTTENKLDLECILRTRQAIFCISLQSPPRKLSNLPCDLKTMYTFRSSLWGNKQGDPRFFSHVFDKNILIKNIFEEEKKFDSRT